MEGEHINNALKIQYEDIVNYLKYLDNNNYEMIFPTLKTFVQRKDKFIEKINITSCNTTVVNITNNCNFLIHNFFAEL